MVEHSLAKADTGVRFPSFAPVKSKSLYEKAFFVYESKRRDGSERVVLFLHVIKDKIQNEMDCACA